MNINGVEYVPVSDLKIAREAIEELQLQNDMQAETIELLQDDPTQRNVAELQEENRVLKKNLKFAHDSIALWRKNHLKIVSELVDMRRRLEFIANAARGLS